VADALAWAPRSFVERIGAALIAPRRALAAADAPEAAGRSGSDAAALLGLALLALYTRELVVAAWLGIAEGLGVGFDAMLALVGRSVGSDLVLILAGGVLVTLAAGRRRAIGRDFDLACVAYVPFVLVKVVASLGLYLAEVRPTRAVTDTIGAVGYGWAAVVLVLAVLAARARRTEAADA